MRVGPIPIPVAAAPAIGFDEVTKGYVPWSRSSSVPCAPSSRTRLPSRIASSTSSDVSATYGRSRCAKRLVPRGDVLELERLVLVDALEPDVLLRERGLDLLAQDLRVEQVLDADPEAGRLVGVGGPDPAPRRPDLELAEPLLARAVDRDVPRHDQVRVARDLRAARRRSRAPPARRSRRAAPPGRRRSRRRGRSTLPERIPEGSWRNLNVSPPTITVCPAFGPPW